VSVRLHCVSGSGSHVKTCLTTVLDEELFMTELLEREGSRHMELAYANGQAASGP